MTSATSDPPEEGAESPESKPPGSGGGGGGTKTPRKAPPTLWQRATYRWTAITAVMAVLLIIYTQHPYYQGGQFAPWRPVYTAAFIGWLAVGLFYIRATLERFQGMRYTMRDGGLHLLLLAKAWQNGRFWRTAKNPRVRTTLLGICVKAFFTPLMTGFLSGQATAIVDHWLRHKHLAPLRFTIPHGSALTQASAWFSQVGARLPDLAPHVGDFDGLFSPSTWTTKGIRWGLDFSYDFVFFIDCGFAFIGYASESRWVGNKTRSVEPTAFGWAVCLACYPPYNNILGTYLPLENGARIVTGETAMLAFRAFTVLLFAIYASATVAFGFRFSNLTNRGIVTRGPYKYVRHPAYLCKCMAWWLEHIPTLTPTKAVFLSGLCGVYALRAWTEERHLSRDPDYRAYKKKTPWVLLPGVY
jgi:protein-S-isoprenylcysteine O-methyltransferase Ste14